MTTADERITVKPLRRNRDFGLLWVGAGFSYLGSRVTALVYPMLLLWGGGSTVTAGLLGFTALLPQLVVQLPAGAFVDRRDRRKLMIASELGIVLAVGSLVVPLLGGHLWLPQLFAVAFVEGSLQVVYQLAERSAVPQLVPPEQLPAAYSGNEARTRAASMLGQPAGTALFAVGNAVPLLLAVGTRIVALASLLGIRASFDAARKVSQAPVLADIGDGIRWLWRQRFLRAVLLILAGTNMINQMLVFAMLPLFRAEGWANGLVGVVVASASAGGLVGALTAGLWMRIWGLRRILIVATAVWAIVTLLVAPVHNVVVIGMLFAASGYVGGAFNVPAIVYVMRITPPEMQGRVSSVANLVSYGAMALGWAVEGPLLEMMTPRQTIITIGAGLTLITVSAILSPAIRGAVSAAETEPLA
ncbi:MFS transporter [Streptomyces odontomachi]|uniref:MFS transporter n=1 Tax=Streptomyces odontomachi TaxID=2944940 RepID=UPI00210DCE6A|nr:MFS transporter [Streptomyces sp. ODS25]